MESIKRKSILGFIWRFAQNTGTQIVSFVNSIVLARLLMPEDYGMVAMITVFTNIAMVFVNTGFTSAIVQRKELSEKDVNTVFYSGLAVSAALYAVLYMCSPFIASFYEEPQLVGLLRAESLIVLIAAFYSVPQSLLIRELQLQKSFLMGLSGAIVQGVVGISLAFLGKGAWAIIIASIANSTTCAIVAWAVIRWRPKKMFSLKSFSEMFMFSVKMLISGLMDAVFNNIRSLVIGKQYSSADLAYYNRGYQFPSLVMTQVDGAMTTVMFSSLSRYQQDWERGLGVLRRVMKTSLYVCTPLMFGLMAAARPLVLLLLTDKWLASVEYVRLVAILCTMWPLSAQKHALNALGKSGVSLAVNVMGMVLAMVSLVLTFRYSISLMIVGSVVASFVTQIISGFVFQAYLGYRIKAQLADILPSFALSALMGFAVYGVEFFHFGNFLTLCIQLAVGVAIYFGLSYCLKIDSFFYLWNIIKNALVKVRARHTGIS